MTLAEIATIVRGVQYPGLSFRVEDAGLKHAFIQVQFVAPDHNTHYFVSSANVAIGTCGMCGHPRHSHETPREQSWGGRKWYVSEHAIEAEVVQTCLKAVLTAIEHEAREQFMFRGVALFHPHISLDALMTAAATRVTRI